MPFQRLRYPLASPSKPFMFLIHELGFSMKEAQRLIDRGRFFYKGVAIRDKGMEIRDAIELLLFVPGSARLRPFFETGEFAIFNKPSNLLVHPNCRDTEYCLLDDVKALFGQEANIVHRLDRETSGLILVGKNRISERGLKMLFENRDIRKSYLAYVKGRIAAPYTIELPIALNKDFSTNKHKAFISSSGKPSTTSIHPLGYDKRSDATLLRVLPLTGRMHQIRVHLAHIGHPILGDCIYGGDFDLANRFLDGVLQKEERIAHTGAERVMLHSHELEFVYKNRFVISSPNPF